jgi:fumarate hydratase subunit alpha
LREIDAQTIKEAVKQLFLKENYEIGQDVIEALRQAWHKEESATGRAILEQILNNHEIAACEKMAICQDTGMAVLFVKLGQDVRIVGGDFNEAVNQGVREAYTEGYLRKSLVDDPVFERKNTKDNTPAVIHLELAPGDKIHILVTGKGFGSENMSRFKMMTPAEGEEEIKKYVVETVKLAGPNPCPPVIIGVGIGGTMEKAAQIAKKATLRKVGQHHPDPRYADMEKDILTQINKLGIGPGGLGGRVTALAVNIDYFPAHIAGTAVAVNVCCHAARHAETEI